MNSALLWGGGDSTTHLPGTGSLCRTLALLSLVLVLTPDARAQDHTGTFSEISEQTRIPYPGVLYAQPSFGLEWWYLTGHLSSGNDQFGFELTFFRVGVDRSPGPGSFSIQDLYFAHFAVTDISGQKFMYGERSSRGALGEAGSNSDRFNVWVGDWSVVGDAEQFRLKAREPRFGLDLVLRPSKPPVFQGKEGYSRKGDEPKDASYYVSLSRIAAQGLLRLEGREFIVSGLTWMDREIMTPSAKGRVRGWDWFSIQLEDNRELMFYRIYAGQGLSDYSSGALILADGRVKAVSLQDTQYTSLETWRSPATGVRYDTEWTIRVPGQALFLEVRAAVQDQEIVARRSTGNAYWEGACNVKGRWDGQTVTGRAYLEMNREGIRKVSSP